MDKTISAPSILLKYPKNFPEQLIINEVQELLADKLDLKIHIDEEENTTYNALEWIIPTTFFVWIFKSYFESFLSEAGKDHYIILKKGLKKIVSKGKLIRGRIITSTYSPEKLSKSYNQSIVISLTIQTKNNKLIKLLFDNNLVEEDWDSAIDQLLDFVIEHYKTYPTDYLTEEISKKCDKEYGTVYALIDESSKKIEFFDDLDMMNKFKN